MKIKASEVSWGAAIGGMGIFMFLILGVVVAGIVGWVTNIIWLVAEVTSPEPEPVLQILVQLVGIFLAPLGSVIGLGHLIGAW